MKLEGEGINLKNRVKKAGVANILESHKGSRTKCGLHRRSLWGEWGATTLHVDEPHVVCVARETSEVCLRV